MAATTTAGTMLGVAAKARMLIDAEGPANVHRRNTVAPQSRAGLSSPESLPWTAEIRNKDYLTPQYLEVLATHKAAHAFNAWIRMPALDEQAQIAEAFTADSMVIRASLKTGRQYDKAVETFAATGYAVEGSADAGIVARSEPACCN
jgi:hypothetical protein